jgi:hypothetical protein
MMAPVTHRRAGTPSYGGCGNGCAIGLPQGIAQAHQSFCEGNERAMQLYFNRAIVERVSHNHD